MFTFTFTHEELQLIAKGLGKLPLEEVLLLYNNIQAQYTKQTTEET